MKARLCLPMLVLCLAVLSGCQASKTGSSGNSLSAALVARNYGDIEEAIISGAALDEVVINGRKENPILYTWKENPDIKIAELLLKHGANVNFSDSKGRTLLMFASGAEPQDYGFEYVNKSGSSIDYCQLFLSYGADPNLTDDKGWTASDYAAWNTGENSYKVLQLLVSYGAKISRQTLEITFSDTTSGYTEYEKIHYLVQMLNSQKCDIPLSAELQAAILGNSTEVIQLYEQGRVSSQEEIPFYISAYCNEAAIKKMVETPGFSCTVDKEGHTLIDVAARCGNVDGLCTLLALLPWSKEDIDHALEYAILYNEAATAQIMFEHGGQFYCGKADWEVFDNIMDTPAARGNLRIIEMLIEHGYSVTPKSAWYAMKNAAKVGEISVISYFEKLGYDIDYCANNADVDRSVLCTACAFDQLETVKWLVEHGADVNAAQKCLPIATENGNYEIVEYLLSCGADPNDKTEYADGSSSDSAIEIANLRNDKKLSQLFE